MKKTINYKHSRSVFIFAVLSLFMCMSFGKVSAVQLKPVVQIENTSYTRSGTEVTLKLWIFNWKLETLNPKQYNSRFTGDVYLYIDDKEVANLKEMWSLISDANFTMFHDIPGYVSDNFDINHNGTKVGYAKTVEQMKAEYREVISLLRKGYSIRDVAKLSGKGVSTVQRVKRLLKMQSPQ